MKRGYRLASVRLGLALVLGVAWAMAAGGCGSLLGIDDGIPFPSDGSVDSTVGVDSSADAPVPDATQGNDTGNTPDTSSSGSDVTTNDSTTMDAPGTDAPGMDAPGMDAPVEAPGDDSGDACVAESTSAACGSNECGTVTNNCSVSVSCGVGGTSNCPSGQTCIMNMGVQTCCTPTTSCGNLCNITTTNSCGQPLQCGGCAFGVCDPRNNTCCMPNGTCGGPCVDNCGQNDSNCCDAGMTMDAMPPPCTPLGDQCGGGQPPCCNSGICAAPPSPPPPPRLPGGTSGSSCGGPILDSGSGSGSGSGGTSGSSSGGASGSSSGIIMPPIDSGPPPLPVCQP